MAGVLAVSGRSLVCFVTLGMLNVCLVEFECSFDCEFWKMAQVVVVAVSDPIAQVREKTQSIGEDGTT